MNVRTLVIQVRLGPRIRITVGNGIKLMTVHTEAPRPIILTMGDDHGLVLSLITFCSSIRLTSVLTVSFKDSGTRHTDWQIGAPVVGMEYVTTEVCPRKP